MNAKAPGLNDVAALAGVSHQTVSRVLNNHPYVSDATRERVQKAISTLNYRRNMSARVLVTGRSNALGVISLNSSLYGPSTTVVALGVAAIARGMTLSIDYISDFAEGTVRAAVDRLMSHGVAGILLILPISAAVEGVPDLVGPGLPVVAVDGPPQSSIATVSVDQYAGAAMATRHLLEAGHPTVWHVAGPADWNDSRAREAGWRDTLTAAGIDVPPLLRGDWSPASGYQAGQLLARMRDDCTAVFAANDHMALGVARALEERGRSIPDDVMLVGFDDVPESAYFSPPLTTVRQDFGAVGRASLDLLLAEPNDATGGALEMPTILIPSSLVIRASTTA